MYVAPKETYELENELGWALKLKFSDEGAKYKAINKAGHVFKENIRFTFDGLKISSSLKEKLQEFKDKPLPFRVYKCHEKLYIFFGADSERETDVKKRDCAGWGTNTRNTVAGGALATVTGLVVAAAAPIWMPTIGAAATVALAVSGCAVVGAGVKTLLYGSRTREENFSQEDLLKEGAIGLAGGIAGGAISVTGGLAAPVLAAAAPASVAGVVAPSVLATAQVVSGVASEVAERAASGNLSKMTMKDLGVSVLSGAAGAGISSVAGATLNSVGRTLTNIPAIDKFRAKERILIGILRGGMSGATQSGTSTIVRNKLENRDAKEKLLESILMGGTLGAVSGGISEAFAKMQKPVIRDERWKLEDEIIKKLLPGSKPNKEGRLVPVEDIVEMRRNLRNLLREKFTDEDLRNLIKAYHEDNSSEGKTSSKENDASGNSISKKEDEPKTTESAPEEKPKETESVPEDAPKTAESAPEEKPKETESVPEDAPKTAESAPKETPKTTESIPDFELLKLESINYYKEVWVSPLFKNILIKLQAKGFKFYEEISGKELNIDQALEEITRAHQVVAKKERVGFKTPLQRKIVDPGTMRSLVNLNNSFEIPRLWYELKNSLKYIEVYTAEKIRLQGYLTDENRRHLDLFFENIKGIFYDITDRKFKHHVQNADMREGNLYIKAEEKGKVVFVKITDDRRTPRYLKMMYYLNKGLNIYDKKGNIIIDATYNSQETDISPSQLHHQMTNLKNNVNSAPYPNSKIEPVTVTPPQSTTFVPTITTSHHERPIVPTITTSHHERPIVPTITTSHHERPIVPTITTLPEIVPEKTQFIENKASSLLKRVKSGNIHQPKPKNKINLPIPMQLAEIRKTEPLTGKIVKYSIENKNENPSEKEAEKPETECDMVKIEKEEKPKASDLEKTPNTIQKPKLRHMNRQRAQMPMGQKRLPARFIKKQSAQSNTPVKSISDIKKKIQKKIEQKQRALERCAYNDTARINELKKEIARLTARLNG